MKILITGGAGFVGANLSFYFKEQGHDVIALDNLARRGVENNLPEFKKKGITFIHGDIRNPEDFYHLKADIILECSAQPSAIDGYNNPKYDITNNLYGVINVLEYCRTHGTAMIQWSTNKCYDGNKVNALPHIEKDTRYEWLPRFSTTAGFDPLYGISSDFSVDGGSHSIYGMTKIQSDLACQEYCDAFNVPTIVNRFSCLAGPRQMGKCAQGWVAWFAIASIFNLPLEFIGWKGKQVRDILFIDDICSLVDAEIKCIDSIKGQVFNIGGGMSSTLSLIEAVDLVSQITGNKPPIAIKETPRKADHVIYISDIRKIKAAVGWEPKVNIKDGYEKIVKWVYDNKTILQNLYL
jgi:CDP-paratose 2-epimerase